MPYVPEDQRVGIKQEYFLACNPGQLNYMITQMCLDYLDLWTEKDYRGHNEIIGVLECVKQEFYRRVVVPYEKIKMEENTDVY